MLSYRDAGEAIDMNGIYHLGEDIGVDAATDMTILVLCWKLGSAEKPGHIMEAEWLSGMEKLNSDSVDKVSVSWDWREKEPRNCPPQ